MMAALSYISAMEAVLYAPPPIAPSFVSLETYFEQEAAAGQKHLYLNGHVLLMPGGTYFHNLVAANVVRTLGNAIVNLPEIYHVLNSDMKIMIEARKAVLYPDALVICREPVFYQERQDVITNPLVIVEVLSPSTAGYDTGVKFEYYTTLESLQEYVLIHPKTREVSSWFREAPDLWRKTETPATEATLKIRALGVEVPMEGIFRGLVH